MKAVHHRAGFAAWSLFALAGTAAAQVTPAGWTNPNDPNAGVLNDSGNVFNAAGLYAPVGDSIRLQFRATATEDKNDAGGAANIRDRFTLEGGAVQEFTADRAANVWAPVFLKGAITFLQNAVAPNANLSNGRIEASAKFERRDPGPGGVGFVWTAVGGAGTASFDLNVNADITPAGDSINAVRVARVNGLAAGDVYRLNVSVKLTGDADRNNLRQSDLNSGVTTSTYRANANDLSTGVITGLSWDDTSTPDSRAMVGKLAARTAFSNVDGRGVLVAVLEPGRVIATPDGLRGQRAGVDKVEQVRYRPDLPVGLTNPADPATRVADGRSEHTTAVASIIAGDAGGVSEQGVAPGARLVSTTTAAFDTAANAFTELATRGDVRVMNMSAVIPGISTQLVDKTINDRGNFIFVKSSGNSGNATPGNSTITNPGLNYNGLTVGNVTATGRLWTTSSTSQTGVGPFKPDLVAPGTNVLAAMPFDTNNDGNQNDFERKFGGSDARYFSNVAATGADPTLGAVRGTSFAAPHVAGVAALMHNLGDNKRASGDFDARSDDSRVLKAVMMNTATRNNVTGSGGRAWSQRIVGTQVNESIDRELGAGMVNAWGALVNYNAGEALASDNNALRNFNITPSAADGTIKSQWWDLERVSSGEVGPPVAGGALRNGTVNYALPTNWMISNVPESGARLGRVMPGFDGLKAALTWNRTTNLAGDAYEALSNLELRLYLENPVTAINKFSFDPDLDSAILLFETKNVTENVKLFDLDGLRSSFFTYTIDLARFGDVLAWQPRFFLQVVNLSANATDYGLSVIVPTPGLACLLIGGGVLAARRRR